MSHISLPLGAAAEARGRSAKIELEKLVSGHFCTDQSWKDEKSHRVVSVWLKAGSWADLVKWLSFRVPSGSSDSCKVTPF